MIHQCPCGFATDDQLWFESHQARHLLRGDGQVVRRDHDLSGLTVGELQRARRELEASLALARPGSVVSNPIMAQIRAIDAALAGPTGLPGSPVALSPGVFSTAGRGRCPDVARCRGIVMMPGDYVRSACSLCQFRATALVTGPRNTGPGLPVPLTGASRAALTPSPYGGDGISVQSGEAGSPVSQPCAASCTP